MANIVKLIKNEDLIVTEWSSGKTTQIYIYPEDANYKNKNFKFRISSATIDLEESEFTKLESVYRFITPLDKKLKLTHNNRDYIELEPFQVYGFDGGLDTTSYGASRDFNLMLANGAKGSLVSIYIDEEYILNEESSSNQYTVIFTYDNDLNIEIDGVNYILKPMETLIISTTYNTSLAIKMKFNNPSVALISKIHIWK